ncbi:MAG: hypothetical protein ABGW98_06435, partial [Myxococcales bacterium]
MASGDSTLIGAPATREVTHEVGAERSADAGQNTAASQDLQSLLTDALRRLVETTDSSRACAWARRPDGEPYVIAASDRDATTPQAPDGATLDALEPLFAVKHPVDLGATSIGILDGEGDAAHATSSALSQLAANFGMSCAMPLHSANDEPVAI